MISIDAFEDELEKIAGGPLGPLHPGISPQKITNAFNNIKAAPGLANMNMRTRLTRSAERMAKYTGGEGSIVRRGIDGFESPIASRASALGDRVRAGSQHFLDKRRAYTEGMASLRTSVGMPAH